VSGQQQGNDQGMHGLVNKAIEAFLGDTYGAPAWHAVVQGAGLWDQVGIDGFDALQVYPDAVTERLLAAAGAVLGRPRESLLEDLGTYLVSHPRNERLRRLLRFGGRCYTDFLRSLAGLRGRARLAVPDLDLPVLTLAETAPGRFRLTCHDCLPGYGLVMLGILRAMGDDYGALVVLEAGGRSDRPGPDSPPGAAPGEWLTIAVHDLAFHAGRDFALAGQASG
jgi:hypothetical protein